MLKQSDHVPFVVKPHASFGVYAALTVKSKVRLSITEIIAIATLNVVTIKINLKLWKGHSHYASAE